MTRRENLKRITNILEKINLPGSLGLILTILSVIFGLPKGQTFMNLFTIDIELVAFIVVSIAFIVSMIYLILVLYWLYLKFTMLPDVEITGESILGQSAEIKIENREPVDLLDVYIKLIRFSWNKSIWNDVKSLTGMTSNNFFSRGLVDVNRTISRSPVLVHVAKPIVANIFTRFLLDNNNANMPLNVDNENSASKEYELVFEITGRFRDETHSTLLGKYYGKLLHQKIKTIDHSAGQHIFKWIEFYKTSNKKEGKLKSEREKSLGFSFSAIES